MTLEKPNIEIQRVYLVARDPESGESKSLTVYETTPEKLLKLIESVIATNQPTTATQAA